MLDLDGDPSANKVRVRGDGGIQFARNQSMAAVLLIYG